MRNGESGQLVLQALLVIVLTGAVIYSTISMLQRTTKHQGSVQMRTKFTEVQNSIQRVLQNEVAWENTINSSDNDSSGIACLRSSTANCTAANANSAFVLKDADGNTYYDSSISTNGFTEDGQPCNSYDGTNGNDTCPIRAILAWSPVEQDGSNCSGSFDCRSQISVTFEHRARSEERRFAFEGASSSKYAINLNREKASRRDYILIVDEKSSGTSGGACTPSTWVTRDLNTERTDTGDNATISSNVVRLTAGTYQCSITAPSAAVGTHQARLRVNGGSVLASGTTGNYYGPSIVNGRFTLASDSDVVVEHICTTSQSSIVSPECTNCDFGRAVSDGANEVYTVLRCIKFTN